jgi:hypothetical protein
MANDLFPEIEDGNSVKGTRGSSQRFLLLVLLLLVAVFGYLYFFTGLIKPRQEAAKAPPEPSTQIRHPLPPRPDQGEEKPAAPSKPVGEQPAQAKAEKSTPSATVPQAKPAAVPPQKAPANVLKGEEKPLHMEQVKTSSAPAPSAGAKQKAGLKQVAVATTAVKNAPKPAGAARLKAMPAEGKGAFTLLIGDFALDREMKTSRIKLKKLGITPIEGKKIEKLEIMHRLFLADYNTHHAAEMELQILRKVVASAFILEQNSRYALYAGSYLHEWGAASEQKRLAGKGFKLSMQTAKVKIPINRVMAGSFTSSADAQKEANRLKKQGIIAKIIKTGKANYPHLYTKA